jgi:hypothetical protein
MVEDWASTRKASGVDVSTKGKRGYNYLELLHLTITFLVWRSFTERPNGSNSTETRLSVVKRQTYIRFLMISGETKTS